MNYKLTLQYDGTKYDGYQRLSDDDNTIQSKIDKTISSRLSENISVTASGRTDKGVHALGQCLNFHSLKELEPKVLMKMLNDHLPNDMAISKVEIVDESFHSRFDATSKTYLYRINSAAFQSPFEGRYSHYMPQKLNVESMKKASEVLLGTHDFSSFTNMKLKGKSKVRTIKWIKIERKGEIIEIEINGDGFLHNMIRIIAGTLIDAGLGKLDKEAVKQILASMTRADASRMAPAKGLFLKEVFYDKV